MRHAICYISTKDQSVGKEEILELFEYCKVENESSGIKGILLYSEGNFFQALEGEKAVVIELFENIQKDRRHHSIVQIVGEDLNHSSIDGFKVGIIQEGEKVSHELPAKYLEALKGISPDVRKSMENMLRTFIATR